jgi:hypothetical protein
MNDRFCGIGENGGRVRHQVRCRLPDEHGHAKRERDSHGKVRLLPLFFLSLVR